MQNNFGTQHSISTRKDAEVEGPVRRVDLVVTEYQTDPEHRSDAPTEFSWTIPVAVLIGDPSEQQFTGSALSRGTSEKDGFLRALETFLISARPQRDRALPAETGTHARAHAAMPAAARMPAARIASYRLTPREQQVLEHVLAGHRNKETAAALKISRRTVEHHRAAVMQKAGARSVPELMRIVGKTEGRES